MTKNVKVSEENHARLLKIGRMVDSMNDVIGDLLDCWDANHKEVKRK